jgi:alpha-glucosidase
VIKNNQIQLYSWLPVNPNYVSLNLKAQKAADESHFKFYQKLSKLRQEQTFLYGDFKILALSRNVFAYVREHLNSDTYVVLINLGGNHETVNLKAFATLRDKLKIAVASSTSDYHEG